MYISTDNPVSPKYNSLLYDLHGILYVWLIFFFYIVFKFWEPFTCCEGRAIFDVACLPVRAVCPTHIMVVSTDDNRSLSAKVLHMNVTVLNS